jgi:hypothetical protein
MLLTESERDDARDELDDMLEELRDAYACINEVSTLSPFTEEALPSPLDGEFAACLVGARDELEAAFNLIEGAKKRL